MAVLDIVMNGKGDAVATKAISDRQGIKISYLEQILHKLKNSEIISSTKGPGGGYSISRPASKIYIIDILNSVEEKIKMTRCNECKEMNCINQETEKCIAHDLWKGLSLQVKHYFSSISLSDVAENKITQKMIFADNVLQQ